MRRDTVRYGTAILCDPRGEDLPGGTVLASSLECNIDVLGKNVGDAMRKLARLLSAHIGSARRRGIDPFVGNEADYARLGRYFSRVAKMPNSYKACIEGFTICAYDLR